MTFNSLYLLLCLLPAAAEFPVWTAHRLFPNVTSVVDATCLDGSPPLYYHSPGFGDGVDKWQIHHEGGAWCGSAEECVGWWGFRSTLVDPDQLPQDAQASTGYFNRSEPKNAMANWNFVFIRYCDGFSFASNRLLPSVVAVNATSNVTAHFRGLAVLQAVRKDLLGVRGMADATVVVVGGCSAGGMAVFIHCDAWAARIARSNLATRTVCLADSGWFPLVPDTGFFPSTWFNGVWQGAFDWHNASAAVSAECLAQHAAAGDGWKCAMAQFAAPLITTPLFMYQSIYDSFQIFNMERCIPMPPDPQSPCTAAQVTAWGGNITLNIRAFLDSPRALAAGSAAFTDACYHHCGTWADFDQITSWVGPTANVTGSQAFSYWLASRAAGTSSMWAQPTSYPCDGTRCCGPHGPDTGV